MQIHDEEEKKDQEEKNFLAIKPAGKGKVKKKRLVRVLDRQELLKKQLFLKIVDPEKVINPFLHYRIGDDTFISEDCFQDQENKSILNVYNTFKKIDYLTMDKKGGVHLYFKDKDELVFPPWQYVAQRFASFGEMGYKAIANAVTCYGTFVEEMSLKASRRPSRPTPLLSNGHSHHNSHNINNSISSSNISNNNSSNNMEVEFQGEEKCQVSDIRDSLLIEDFFQQNLDKAYMIFRKTNTGDGQKFRSMHFSKKFINNLGWESEEFQTEALFNGIPEVLGNRFYKANVVRTLSNLKDMIENRANSIPPPEDSNMELISKNGLCRNSKVLFKKLSVTTAAQMFYLEVTECEQEGYVLEYFKNRKRKPVYQLSDLEKECVSNAFELIDPADLDSNVGKTCKIKPIQGSQPSNIHIEHKNF